MCKLTPDEKLTLKLTNEGRMNLHEWVERIVEDYITEQAIENRISLDTIKDILHGATRRIPMHNS